MTKELSKQICEICGIQTHGKLIFHKRNWDDKCYISAGRGYKEFDFKSCPNVTVDILPDNQWEEKMGWQYPYKQIEEIKQLYDKNGYDFVEFKTESIDFGQPENFCKLADLSIETMYNKTIFWLVTQEYPCEDREYFLGKFYEILKTAVLPDYNLNSIKQAIREAEWKYE